MKIRWKSPEREHDRALDVAVEIADFRVLMHMHRSDRRRDWEMWLTLEPKPAANSGRWS